jgi:hypothetical protein
MAAVIRVRRPWIKRSLAVSCFIVLAGCIDSQKLREAFDPCARDGCAPAPPQDCASLSAADWAVDGYLTASETKVSLGESSQSNLAPAVEQHCQGAVVSVEWHVGDPGVASILPTGRYVWVSGLTLGLTSLGARIQFSDGVVRDARPRPIRVVAPAAVQGQLVIESDLTIAPYVPGTSNDWSGWVPFTTTTTGRIDVIVDWVSPLDRIDFSGYEGHCSSVGACGTIRLLLREHDVKPLHATFDSLRTPPGDFTIRIDNLGPAEETVHVAVRLVPS